MAIQVSYPGVYIEEFAPGAPIAGVGTNTAAFIGVAAKGDMDTPTKLTSWDQFRDTFGAQPVSGFHLWYAVRGFFENGGQVCYVVRASNGSHGEGDLVDAAVPSHSLIHVRARQPGLSNITVAVTARHVLHKDKTHLFQPAELPKVVSLASRDLTLPPEGAAQFRPGDLVTIEGGAGQAAVIRITGSTLRLDSDISGAVGAKVRLGDLPTGTRTIRIASSVSLEPGALTSGTVLTIDPDKTTKQTLVVESVQTEYPSPTTVTYRVTFRDGLKSAISLATPPALQSEEFRITVGPGAGKPYDDLSIDPAHPRYYVNIINDDRDALVRVAPVEPPPPVGLPAGLPANTSITLTGDEETLATIKDSDFIAALDELRDIDDVNLIAIPDRITPAVQQAVIAHCQQLADRFAVLDAEPSLDLFGDESIETQRRGLDSTRGYAALYYPWLRVSPAGPGAPILAPPSGHVCGIIARSDSSRGVHKAPANEIVNGTLGIERTMTDVEQGLLNLQGINVIRIFQTGGRPVLWGARTTSTDTNWQYVNVRRLFLFLEESIQEGIRWAIFEPNNTALWGKLRRTITEFLTRVWRDGALYGATAKEAFYVRIDEVLNPDSSRALGRLNVEVGVRPSYPAEFIIVRIGIWQGGSQITEG